MTIGRLVPALLLAMIALAAAPAEPAAEAPTVFIDGFEDVPLMPGLTVVEDAGVAFDSPSGRIVEAVAEGKVAAHDVLDFYARTLPQMGWTGSGTSYRREDEVLRLEVTIEGGEVTVNFLLSPAD